jgi:nitrite reductase/ring-hydroxylating ferredoxin subunit
MRAPPGYCRAQGHLRKTRIGRHRYFTSGNAILQGDDSRTGSVLARAGRDRHMNTVHADAGRTTQLICRSAALAELNSYCFAVQYRGERRETILIRHSGTARCFLNQCRHMSRRLDCEHRHVFDETGKYLRCSMHGIIYDPVDGLCQSEICAGKYLTRLKIVETNGSIYLQDKRARLHAG